MDSSPAASARQPARPQSWLSWRASSATPKVDTKNPERGPLLILDGELDHVVPWAIANASYNRQKRNTGVTEIVKVAGRGHALTIDGGWREIADLSLAFIQRFVSAGG
jgi:non-heme chloroperoxidase